MKSIPRLFGLITLLLAPISTAKCAELIPLRVLYLGNGKKDRDEHFGKFLDSHFVKTKVMKSADFTPTQGAEFDVVLFDWSQSDGDLSTTRIPLGKFSEWNKPTVLLNSAGLLVSGQWQLIGNAG